MFKDVSGPFYGFSVTSLHTDRHYGGGGGYSKRVDRIKYYCSAVGIPIKVSAYRDHYAA